MVLAALVFVAQLAGALQPTRRDMLAMPLAAAAATAAPRPARSVVAGPAASLADAKASGAVALWIDLAGCDVCRHDVPAACTGTLIADDLVLSAQHCIDVPESLNGALTKIVFGTDIFDAKAVSVPVSRYVRPKDVPGLSLSAEALGDDLVLIKLARKAPKDWRRVDVGGGGDVAAYSRSLRLFGFGDSVDSDTDYSSGVLRRIDLVPVTAKSDAKSDFLARPLDYSGKTGTCNGDSGGAVLLEDPGRPPRVLGVVSSTSLPCAGSTTRLVNPSSAALAEFVRRGSQVLGTPLEVKI